MLLDDPEVAERAFSAQKWDEAREGLKYVWNVLACKPENEDSSM